MSRSEKTRQIILKLKEVKYERNLSDPQIHRMVTDKGFNVSLSSVVRVFKEGSEDQGFRYEDTIQPIAITLLETDEPPKEVSGVEETQAEALRQLVQLKNSIIAEKDDTIAYLKEQLAAKEDRLHKQDTLLAERREFIYDKDRTIAELRKEVKSQNRLRAFLVLVIIAMLLVIIAALIVDMMNPNMGFFWLENAAAWVASHSGVAGSVDSASRAFFM